MTRVRHFEKIDILPPEGVSGDAPGAAPSDGALRIAPATIYDRFEGLALVLDGDGRLLGASPPARTLAEALDREGLPEKLAAAALAFGPRGERVTLGDGRTFDFTLFPLLDGGVLVLARDLTFDRNLHEALVESRGRYKDIVGCSSDFAWETGADGRFVFVSPRGALGYTATELVGRHPRELLSKRQDARAPLPFASAEPLDGATVWMRRADGADACLSVACVPRFDGEGHWLGARGVCRDITEARARDEALARARARERLVVRLVNGIREEVDPERLLARAADAAGAALDVDFCWIFRIGEDGRYYRAASHGLSDEDGPLGFLATELAAVSEAGEPVEMPVEGFRVLAAITRHHGARNGAVCVGRAADRAGWNEDERALLAAVAEHLGIAIEQIANHEVLKRLSRTDELTGLLNRRAFDEELANRYQMARRSGRKSAILYVDLDNFKAVNDVHGHKQGDAVLKGWAAALKRYSRAGDVVARLGGDEFAVWLEDTDEAGAQAKARSLLEAARGLERYSGDAERPLGASIGIAVLDPATGESLDGLIARADAAMYVAKHGGKGRVALAPPASENGGGKHGKDDGMKETT